MLENYDIALLRECASDFDTSIDLFDLFRKNVESHSFSTIEGVLELRRQYYYSFITSLIKILEKTLESDRYETLAITDTLSRLMDEYYFIKFFLRQIEEFKKKEKL